MRTIEDYLEYLILGSFAFISMAHSAYVLLPTIILPLLQWFMDDTTRIAILLPLIFIIGLISQRIAYQLNNTFLHRSLLEKQSHKYKDIVDLANRTRQSQDNSIGRTLEWGRHLMYQFGSDEIKKQNLRILYAYRISYGSFFLLLFPLLSAIVGLFFPYVNRTLCICTIIICVILLVGTLVSTISYAKNLWRDIYYSTKILLESQIKLSSTNSPKSKRQNISDD